MSADPHISAMRSELVAEGWTERQVEAAVAYAISWAQSNASVGAGGNPDLYGLLFVNYMESAVVNARRWLRHSRRWIDKQAQPLT